MRKKRSKAVATANPRIREAKNKRWKENITHKVSKGTNEIKKEEDLFVSI